MLELLRTNDLVLISKIEAILSGRDIEVLVADSFMSALEGSTGFLPRRVLVHQDDAPQARRILAEYGLSEELR